MKKTEDDYKKELNDLEYYVLRKAGTERPFPLPSPLPLRGDKTF